jgi:hypothetical protein
MPVKFAPQTALIFILLLAPGLSAGEPFNDAITQLTNTLIETPAATTIIGTDASAVIKPTSLRSLSLALGQGFDENGKLKNGWAIEFNPALVFDLVSPIAPSVGARAIARTSLSVASQIKDSGGQVYGFGLNSTLWHPGLDRANAHGVDCTKQATGVKTPDVTPDLLKAALIKAQALELAKCMPSYLEKLKRADNGTALAVGFGTSHQSGLTSSGGKNSAKLAWLTGRWNFNEAQEKPTTEITSTVHLRHTRDGAAADPTGGSASLGYKGNLVSVALRVDRPWGAAFVEHSLDKRTYVGLSKENRQRTLLGTEFKIGTDLTFQLAAGKERGRLYGKADPVVLAGVKWAFVKAAPAKVEK